MAFNPKAYTLVFFVLVLFLDFAQAESTTELSLAEQKEKSLESRYRRILGLFSRATLRDKQEYSKKLEVAKLNWDRQRLALGMPAHYFPGSDIPKPLPTNDLDQIPKNIVPANHTMLGGDLSQIPKPSDWIASKLRSLLSTTTIQSKPNYLLSSTRKVDFSAPQNYQAWKFWSYQKENDIWLALKSGHHHDPFELVCPLQSIETYAFTEALKHPSKTENLQIYQVEIDVTPPTSEMISWKAKQLDHIDLSWSFADKNLAQKRLVLVMENKNLEQSTVLIDQPTTGSYKIEPHKARWILGISFLVFDLAGNHQDFHFEIKR